MNHVRNAKWMEDRGHEVQFFCIKDTPVEKINAIGELWPVITALLGGPWGVVMAYIGTAAYSDVRILNKYN